MSQPPTVRSPSDDLRSGVLPALTSLAHDLVGAVTAEHVVDRMVDALRQLVAPDRLLIVLHEAPGRNPRVACAIGVALPQADDPLIALTERAGPLLLGANVRERLAGYGITLPDPPGSWIGVPLAAVPPLGAVSLGASTPGRFTRETLDIVRSVVTQATIALQNTRLTGLLSEGKREWEQTVDAITQGICVVDAAGMIRRANRTFCALVDIPLTAVSGRPWVELLPPGWIATVERLLADPASGETAELRAGDRLFVLSTLPLQGVGQAAAVLVFDDQTEKRRLQEQLIQSEKMSAIGQLIAGVAHDLNNPLASVVGFSDYLVETSGAAPPELLEPLRAIQQEAERAANIVKNLLTFARKQERRMRVVPVATILENTLVLLRNQLVAAKIEVEVDVVPGVPDVNVDVGQIQQVFVNLIHNAAQAMHGSGIGSRIVIRAIPWLDGAAITIEDDGPGIPPALAERIFEPFFTTKGAGEGTGLGLSISHGIVREHGGRLSLVPTAHRGAVFQVELPAGGPPSEPHVQPPVLPRALRILVVDDEPHIQHYMRATLEAWGHTVTLANNGAKALDEAVQASFDAIISDLRMPELGGREMFERLTRAHPHIAERVIFSTGDTVRGDTLAFLESLGRPYLRKPFTLTELRAALADLIQRTRTSTRGTRTATA
jgi:signal transduction histidine kinase/CheY-like chemotaxis protein